MMIFANNVVLVDENIKVLDGRLECRRQVLKKNGMKISRTKMGFIVVRIRSLVGGNKGKVIMLDLGRSTHVYNTETQVFRVSHTS